MEALGAAASEAMGASSPVRASNSSRGSTDPGSSPAVDRTVTLPEAHGPAVAGVTHDARGFVHVDGHARTAHDPRVYAAGDATALSLKHSTLASSQATAAAEAIAAEAGADLTPTPWSAVLYGLLTLPPRYPGARGSPWMPTGSPPPTASGGRPATWPAATSRPTSRRATGACDPGSSTTPRACPWRPRSAPAPRRGRRAGGRILRGGPAARRPHPPAAGPPPRGAGGKGAGARPEAQARRGGAPRA